MYLTTRRLTIIPKTVICPKPFTRLTPIHHRTRPTRSHVRLLSQTADHASWKPNFREVFISFPFSRKSRTRSRRRIFESIATQSERTMPATPESVSVTPIIRTSASRIKT